MLSNSYGLRLKTCDSKRKWYVAIQIGGMNRFSLESFVSSLRIARIIRFVSFTIRNQNAIDYKFKTLKWYFLQQWIGGPATTMADPFGGLKVLQDGFFNSYLYLLRSVVANRLNLSGSIIMNSTKSLGRTAANPTTWWRNISQVGEIG